ncbi:hypothetical protein CAOG_04744 [Capsaspora owczarzaki ATCC 30864]|uniref:Uncharacterized protein n=1 Tax=Capsaspora owczarzaki (strain ATCC 30864) TaxID=595528 RepID=A0A0D2VSH7_CAPO3|nr:hypothetical protein CAOG_04744 [Capsaspora owczarzaki ATCC 30864]KJE94047.1 hypothetical protein CAOG_004744 [Capsaspora owczarzaki ATCC 30864]|eukprot:XP_004347495.1 hypothetical protein CAOG_04744 [Capsaspora owczarzaki ATCC 30864]
MLNQLVARLPTTAATSSRAIAAASLSTHAAAAAAAAATPNASKRRSKGKADTGPIVFEDAAADGASKQAEQGIYTQPIIVDGGYVAPVNNRPAIVPTRDRHLAVGKSFVPVIAPGELAGLPATSVPEEAFKRVADRADRPTRPAPVRWDNGFVVHRRLYEGQMHDLRKQFAAEHASSLKAEQRLKSHIAAERVKATETTSTIQKLRSSARRAISDLRADQEARSREERKEYAAYRQSAAEHKRVGVELRMAVQASHNLSTAIPFEKYEEVVSEALLTNAAYPELPPPANPAEFNRQIARQERGITKRLVADLERLADARVTEVQNGSSLNKEGRDAVVQRALDNLPPVVPEPGSVATPETNRAMQKSLLELAALRMHSRERKLKGSVAPQPSSPSWQEQVAAAPPAPAEPATPQTP